MKTDSRPLVVSTAAGHAHEQAPDHAHGDHDHAHSHAPQTESKMRLALGLTILILLVEVVGGLTANSLALLADAGHMLTDVFAVGLSWFALVQSRRPADARRTFGYHRVSILAALLNAATLLPISAFIIWEAVGRFGTQPEIQGTIMFGVALIGLVANTLIGLSLHGEASGNLNIQSAVIHVMGDAVASGGVQVAAVVIALTGWTPIDPLLSIGIALLVAFSGARVVLDTVRILLESVPKDVDAAVVAARMKAVPGVLDVHDLHIWQISQGLYALSCHVKIADQLVSQCSSVLAELNHLLEHEFRISHSTIQPECAGCNPNTLYCAMTPIVTPDVHGGPHLE